MKNNQVTFILVVVFLLSTLATALLGQKYNSAFRQAQDARLMLGRMQYTQALAQHLLADTLEYSKKNPDIQPLLQLATNNSAQATAPKTNPK